MNEPRHEPLSERALQRLLAMAADGDAGAAPVAPPSLPARYELVREIGRGGMGVVYEAIDHQLGRRCALKTLGARGGTDDELRARFAREALAAARLQHPHVAAVYDATPDYISMQLIAGGPIGCAPALAARAAVELVRDAARALQHAHEQGIVHRDLKPSNLLVEAGHVFVVDFGLAKAIDAGGSLSLAGAVVGTPAFMPPEQALGKSGAADPRSDVYGLGATLFFCLSGRPPFEAPDLPALLRAVVEQDAPRLPGDRDLALVAGKCLAKEPEQRYASASALADDLERWLRNEPVHARAPSFGHRLKKRLQRQRALWRAAALAFVVGALVLVPLVLHESAATTAANEAAELADHSAALLQEAAMFARLGDNQSAQQVLDAGIQRVGEYLTRHEVPRARYLLARLLRARSQPDEALVELDRALASDPQLADARFERGLLLAARTDTTDADRALAVADLAAPAQSRSVLTSLDLLFGRGEAARLGGDHTTAMELLKGVLEYDPAHVAARLSLSRAAFATGQPDLGRYYATSAVNFQQGYGPVFLARDQQAMPRTMLGLDGALVDFWPQLRDSPDDALANAYRGLVQLRRALRLDGEGRPADGLSAAQGAVDDHRQALVVHEGLAGAHNNLAVCLLVAERLHAKVGDVVAAAAARGEAEAAAAHALSLAPELPEAHFNTGLIALRAASLLRAMARPEAASARADGAATAFTRALELAPEGWPHAPACRAQLTAARALGAAGR